MPNKNASACSKPGRRGCAKSTLVLFALALAASAPALALTVTTPVAAETPAERRATADALFDEARRLMNAQRYAEACPKLAESQSLDAAVGTLLNLALCYEKVGKTASAFMTYRRVANAAREKGQTEREQIANSRAASLESSLARLVITPPPPLPEGGLEVRRDGTLVDAAALGAAIPVDPGKHVVTATAPGKRPFRVEIEIPARASRSTATIPALEDAPGEGPAAVRRRHHIAAATLGGAAVVSIVVGGALGVSAISRNNASQDHCFGGNLCDAEGVALRDQALVRGNVSTAAFVVGGAAALSAVAVYFTAPAAVRAAVGSVGSGAGLRVGGAF